MSKFFNIQTDSDGVGTIFLYGDIGDYYDVQSGRVAKELMEAKKVNRRVNVRIQQQRRRSILRHRHLQRAEEQQGGRAYLCGRHRGQHGQRDSLVRQARGDEQVARLMLHSVSGGCYGNKKDMQKCIEEIESLEDSLGDIYASRSA